MPRSSSARLCCLVPAASRSWMGGEAWSLLHRFWGCVAGGFDTGRITWPRLVEQEPCLLASQSSVLTRCHCSRARAVHLGSPLTPQTNEKFRERPWLDAGGACVYQLLGCCRRELQTLCFVGGWRDARRDGAGREEDHWNHQSGKIAWIPQQCLVPYWSLKEQGFHTVRTGVWRGEICAVMYVQQLKRSWSERYKGAGASACRSSLSCSVANREGCDLLQGSGGVTHKERPPPKISLQNEGWDSCRYSSCTFLCLSCGTDRGVLALWGL